MARLRASGHAVGVSPRVAPDRLRLDLALARNLEEAARAGESGRFAYSYGARLDPAEARILPAGATVGTPVPDPFGRPLYRVALPSPPAP